MVDLLVVAAPDGTQIVRVPAPRPLRAAQGRLARLQRQAARQHGPYDPRTRTRRVPSRRWRPTQARIIRLYTHAASIRRDVLHKATTTLACQHQVVVVETLNVAGMLRSGGARKRGLNRALADASLAEIVACSLTRPPGTVRLWSEPTAGTPHRRPALGAGL